MDKLYSRRKFRSIGVHAKTLAPQSWMIPANDLSKRGKRLFNRTLILGDLSDFVAAEVTRRILGLAVATRPPAYGGGYTFSGSIPDSSGQKFVAL